MRRRTYVALCTLACVTPIALVLADFALGTQPDASAIRDIQYAALGSFAASILTYPAGALAGVVSWIPIYLGLLTPTEAVLLAAPLYVGAGYLQWYILMPKYFGMSPNRAFESGRAEEPRAAQRER